jgi:hypothetical protein
VGLEGLPHRPLVERHLVRLHHHAPVITHVDSASKSPAAWPSYPFNAVCLPDAHIKFRKVVRARGAGERGGSQGVC